MLCRACEARHQGICGALDPGELLALARWSSRHEHPPGTMLNLSGEASDRFANILSGVVKLSTVLPDGRQQIVELQFAPDFVGRPFARESPILAETATTVRLCSFPKRTLEGMADAAPALARRMHLQSLRQLDDARDWMVTLGRRSATEKVAAFLLLLARHIDPEAGTYAPRFELPLHRSDIADFLGLTIETVSRCLGDLRRAGIVEIERVRHVVVRDHAALEARASL